MQSELKAYDEKMEKCINFLTEDLATLRAGRANPSVLNKIQVSYYGTPTPVAQIGNVSVPEPHTILIQPWDATVLGELEKAILKSDLGITPQNDGKVIRLNFPALTEERRKELVKTIHKKCEDSKVQIRNVRRDAIEHFKKLEKSHEITEDDLKDLEKDAQKLTDAKIKEIDDICRSKEKEILEV